MEPGPFFHNSACAQVAFEELREGQAVTFERGQGQGSAWREREASRREASASGGSHHDAHILLGAVIERGSGGRATKESRGLPVARDSAVADAFSLYRPAVERRNQLTQGPRARTELTGTMVSLRTAVTLSDVVFWVRQKAGGVPGPEKRRVLVCAANTRRH